MYLASRNEVNGQKYDNIEKRPVINLNSHHSFKNIPVSIEVVPGISAAVLELLNAHGFGEIHGIAIYGHIPLNRSDIWDMYFAVIYYTQT